MSSIRIVCRWDQPTADGKIPLCFKVSGSKFLTGECLPGKTARNAWDQKAQAVDPRYTGADQTNKRLTKKKAAFISILETQKDFDVKKIRTLFEKYLNDPTGFDLATEGGANAGVSAEVGAFYSLVQAIIEDHRNQWSEGYIKRFRSIRTKFLDHDPEFTPEKLTASWWRGYVDYCVETLGNVNNTINTDAKTTCRLIDELQERGYTFPKGIKEDISCGYIEPEITSLSWDKILKLAAMDLRDHFRPTFELSRVLWLVGAFTGRRWGEIEKMDEKNFYKDQAGRWRYKATGKGMRAVDLPLLPEAVAFFKKIKFKIPRLVQQTVNLDIKEICKLAGFNDQVLETQIKGKNIEETLVPEYNTVHVHTGRHSYAEHIVDISAGQPHSEKFVSFMLGHASFQTTWKYINRRRSSNLQMFDKIIPSKALQK